jgi:hypothetical protein
LAGINISRKVFNYNGSPNRTSGDCASEQRPHTPQPDAVREHHNKRKQARRPGVIPAFAISRPLNPDDSLVRSCALLRGTQA